MEIKMPFQKRDGEISDEELILRYRDGEEGIIDIIMEKYKNLLKKAKM